MAKQEPVTYGHELGIRLRRAREMRQLSQGILAKRSGVPQNQISRIENGGTQDPGTQLLRNLCVVLDVSMDHLCGMHVEDRDRYLREEGYTRYVAQV